MKRRARQSRARFLVANLESSTLKEALLFACRHNALARKVSCPHYYSDDGTNIIHSFVGLKAETTKACIVKFETQVTVPNRLGY